MGFVQLTNTSFDFGIPGSLYSISTYVTTSSIVPFSLPSSSMLPLRLYVSPSTSQDHFFGLSISTQWPSWVPLGPVVWFPPPPPPPPVPNISRATFPPSMMPNPYFEFQLCPSNVSSTLHPSLNSDPLARKLLIASNLSIPGSSSSINSKFLSSPISSMIATSPATAGVDMLEPDFWV